MNQAQTEWNVPAMVAGVLAILLMIVAVDQLFWRPIVVWSERFKLEDTASADASTSWVLTLFQRSSLLRWAQKKWRERHTPSAGALQQIDLPTVELHAQPPAKHGPRIPPAALTAIKWAAVIALAGLAAWGAFVLARLMVHLPLREHGDEKGWTTVLVALLLSFMRTSAAVLLGGLWTLPAGVLIGLSPRLSNRLQPVVQIVASFPAPMIFPIVVFLLLRVHVPFTIGCVALMLLGTQWYTLFNVIAGAMAVPSELREAGAVFHMNAWQRWTRLYIPSVFPYLVTGLITAAGGAWNATIVSEYMSLQHRNGTATVYSAFGLGSLIDEATDASNWPLLAASVVVMGLAVVIINRLVWKRVYHVAEQRYTLNT